MQARFLTLLILIQFFKKMARMKASKLETVLDGFPMFLDRLLEVFLAFFHYFIAFQLFNFKNLGIG